MTPLPETLLAHRHLYIPWDSASPKHEIGAPLARRLNEVHDKPVTLVCPNSSVTPLRTAASSIVTEREGAVVDGGIVLVYWPSHRLARKFVNLDRSIVILAEGREHSYLGWARLRGAYNVVTGDTHSDGLSVDARHLVDQIVDCGDLGWIDTAARTSVEGVLDSLAALRQLSPEIILSLARYRWGPEPVRALEKIIDSHSRAPRYHADGTYWSYGARRGIG